MNKGRNKIGKIKCLKCEKEKSSISNNFYMNTHPLFSSEKLDICKECINDYLGEKESAGHESRIKLVLSLMNKPFLYEEWTGREKDWSRYITQISSLPQYKGMTFADSVFNKTATSLSDHKKESSNIAAEESEENITQEDLRSLIGFWGKGLEKEDYLFLQNEYEKFLNSYECDSYAMELLFQEASHQRLTIKKSRESNKSVEKELKTLQDLLGSANIKPVQETGSNAVEQATFGTLIKKYENEKPIPEPDESWQDVDGIRKYIQIWFFGHLCKMLGIKNEYSEHYEKEVNKYKVESPEYQDDEGDL
jgi:hypothetical protein